jgi:hypothetical protein
MIIFEIATERTNITYRCKHNKGITKRTELSFLLNTSVLPSPSALIDCTSQSNPVNAACNCCRRLLMISHAHIHSSSKILPQPCIAHASTLPPAIEAL